MDLKKGDHLGLSSIQTTVHLGAHVDAPNHYSKNGLGISDRSLEYYLGPCQVILVQLPREARIQVRDCIEALSKNPGSSSKLLASRVLFKTESFPDPDQWNGDFNSLSSELVEWLADQGVRLVGIDTPSIDPAEDRTLEAHQAIARRDLAILEGIVLTNVPEGLYQLIALPLRIENADASPVRAILLPIENTSAREKNP